MTSRSHTACRRCGRNAHGSNDNHLCGRCWRSERAEVRKQRLESRLAEVSAKVVGEHDLSMAVSAVLGDRPYADDWVTTQVIEGVTAAVQQGELSPGDLERRALARQASAHFPEVAQLFLEDEPEEEPVAAEPTKRCARCGETKPLDEFSLNRKARDGRQGYCKTCSRGMWQNNKYVPKAVAVAAPVPPAEDLRARVAELQAELDRARAATAVPQHAPQWRVSWQVTRSGEQVVEARTMVEAIELVRQEVGGDVEITGAVRE